MRTRPQNKVGDIKFNDEQQSIAVVVQVTEYMEESRIERIKGKKEYFRRKLKGK